MSSDEPPSGHNAPAPRKRQALSTIELGPLPVARINKSLGTELAPGNVILSVNAQRHILKRHEKDYVRCLPFLAATIIDPSYAGDDLKNSGFELIRRMPGGDGLLVAIQIEPNEAGDYVIVTMYPVTQFKIDSRRQQGFLKVCP